MRSRIDVDVAVVGAGLSGLVAARRLDQAGVDVCVVEASDRIGGRLLNAEVAPGIELEIGGRFVGGEEHTQALVEEMGGKTFDADAWGGDAVYQIGGERTVGGGLPMSDATRVVYERAVADLDALAARVSPREPWNAPGASELDRVTFAAWLQENVSDERARWGILLDLIIAWITPPWRLSLLHAATTIAALGGVAEAAKLGTLRIVDGPSSVCQKMAEELGDRIHLSSPVERIEWGGGVTVESPELVVGCRQAIVAMSPADAHWISFEPGLPWDRDIFHRHFLMGSGVMTVLAYERPFWRDDGLSGTAISDLPGGGHLRDNSPPDGSVGVINSFVCPLPEGLPWGTPRGTLDTPEDRRRAVTAAAVAAFGEQAAEPINYVEKDWMNERFISGVQGAMPPGLITEAGPSMLASQGPLHWCSSEQGTRWALTMNGAVQSGERIAADVRKLL